MNDYDKTPWYVLYTLPRSEKKVNEKLLEKKYISYLPLHCSIREWRNRKIKTEIPLFPGYVFVKSQRHDLYFIKEMKGVVNFVSFYKGEPAVVPDKEIEMVKKILNQDCEVRSEQFYKVGQPVVIQRGPLAGMVGTLIEERSKSRFLLRINSIQQGFSIEIQTSCLEPEPCLTL